MYKGISFGYPEKGVRVLVPYPLFLGLLRISPYYTYNFFSFTSHVMRGYLYPLFGFTKTNGIVQSPSDTGKTPWVNKYLQKPLDRGS